MSLEFNWIYWLMLDFNIISDSRLNLELQMSDRVVLYMDENLRERPTTFMFRLEPSFAIKGLEFC